VEPQTPPPSTGHWQRPPSLFHTARFTWAGTWSGFAGGGSRSGFSTSPLPLGVALEEEVQPGLQDLALAGAGMRVGERGASGRELLDEPARHRHVQSPKIGGERLDGGARRRRHKGRNRLLDRVGMGSFVRMKWEF